MPTVYRIEVSPNNRAGCQNTECKKAGVKIVMGELRHGTLVEIEGRPSWRYKHWGCVTPANFESWQEITGGDLTLVDGLDELPEDLQEKVVRAIEQGHVDDEEWKGDAERNRPGQKGYRTPQRVKKQMEKEAAEGEGGEEESPTKRKPQPKKRKSKADEDDEDDQDGKTKKSRGRPKKAAKTSMDGADDDNSSKASAPPKSRGRPKKEESANGDEVPEEKPAKKAKKATKAAKTADADEDGESARPAKRGRKANKATDADDGAEKSTKGRGRPKKGAA